MRLDGADGRAEMLRDALVRPRHVEREAEDLLLFRSKRSQRFERRVRFVIQGGAGAGWLLLGHDLIAQGSAVTALTLANATAIDQSTPGDGSDKGACAPEVWIEAAG